MQTLDHRKRAQQLHVEGKTSRAIVETRALLGDHSPAAKTNDLKFLSFLQANQGTLGPALETMLSVCQAAPVDHEN